MSALLTVSRQFYAFCPRTLVACSSNLCYIHHTLPICDKALRKGECFGVKCAFLKMTGAVTNIVLLPG